MLESRQRETRGRWREWRAGSGAGKWGPGERRANREFPPRGAPPAWPASAWGWGGGVGPTWDLGLWLYEAIIARESNLIPTEKKRGRETKSLIQWITADYVVIFNWQMCWVGSIGSPTPVSFFILPLIKSKRNQKTLNYTRVSLTHLS